MAYPAAAPVLTNIQSVDLIAQSEATVIQGLNELFCDFFVDPVLASTLPAEDKLVLISNVLNTMACKECTVANVLEAAAEYLAVDKGLLPTTNPGSNGSNPTPCAYCR